MDIDDENAVRRKAAEIKLEKDMDAIFNKPAPTCGNCRFSLSATDGQGKINWHQRFCRWGPPTPVVVGMGPTGPVIQCFWPTMQATANCGRHEFRDSGERLPGDTKPVVEEAKLS